MSVGPADLVAVLAACTVAAAVAVVSSGRTRPARSARSAGPPRRAAAPGRLGSPRPVVGIGLLVLAAVVVVVGPGPAGVLGAGVLLARARVARAAVRRRERELQRAVPDLVDLFALAASAGHPPRRCLELVADRAPPATRAPVQRARDLVACGAPFAEAVGAVSDQLGPLGPALTDALVAGAVTGAPLAPALAGVAATARDHRRRSAETAARRLPVTLLFPLVCCVLPAFALLAVVPLLAASLASLGP